jgi:tetratricopeptide (TPR) repeat protein
MFLITLNRYSERCGEAENLLAVISLAKKDELLNAWCVSEINKIESLRQGKESGDAAFRRGKYHAAIALYSDAIALDPKASSVNAVLYCNRAAAHMALEKYEAAYNDCTTALSLRPSYPKAKLRRARAALKSQRFTEAVDDFENYLSEISKTNTSVAGDDSFSAVSAELSAAKAAQKKNDKAREVHIVFCIRCQSCFCCISFPFSYLP